MEWMTKQKDAGKLDDEDLQEVQRKSGGLKVGDGRGEVVLRDVVIQHVRRSGLSVWYGVVVIVLGLLVLLPSRKQKA